MLTFYLIAGGLALLASVALVRPLIAGRGAADSRGAHDAQVFRDQLAEIERDLARGTITHREADGARIEVSRRLLAADLRATRGDAAGPAPQGHSGLLAGLALVGTPALAVIVYLGLGAPGVPDQPLASRADAIAMLGGTSIRPAQEEAEAAMAGRLAPQEAPDPRYVEMVRRLESVVAERPDDIRGQKLLANALMNLGRYAEGWRAYDRVIELAGGAADAGTHAAKAEGMILAAGGYVSPEAEAAIARALTLDPSLPIARYYGGLALEQAGRTDEAVAMWEALRRDSPEDAPYLPWLDMMLADTRQQGGAPSPEATVPGPTGAEIAAAQQLSPDDRAAMIEGMVARLETRLTGQGGSAEEWLRLIDAYVKLDRRDEAARAYRLAAEALTGDPQAGFVREQALLMGVPVE
ncbi:MAG TPA: c-type cytochrome biogenesis protein CcmI [Paracoccaceae bacterium]|nr:c-type cytochrome biogenesis protein CcmI [Paracoccaceae bacterium]